MSARAQVRRSFLSPRFLTIGLCLGLGLVASPAGAQVYTPASDDGYWSDEIPAHLSVVDGTATLERDGVVERAEPNLILLSGDRLRTDQGRIEILFADGSAVALDTYSTIDLLDASLMRLYEGRVRITIARATGDVEYRVDTVAGSALLRTPGEFRVSLANGDTAQAEVDVTVIRGSAELSNQYGRTLVRAGTYAAARADVAPSLPYTFNSAARDEFDAWADTQQDVRLGYASARYLPSELHYSSGVFDRYGSWAYEPSYGSHVWYPQVSPGWRPYSVGRWSVTAGFGHVWVGVDRWSWPTHHYGRWGVNGGRWYWIPGRTWSPAWVSWASAPGYVGWCPLGFNNRPVYSVTTISVHYNQPYYGWTVLPESQFGHGVAVSRHAVARGQAVPRTWSEFAERQTAPATTVRTSQAAPLRSPSAARTAVRRAGSADAARPLTGASAAGRAAAVPRDGAAGAPAARSAVSRGAPASGQSAPAVRGGRAAAPRGTAASATPPRDGAGTARRAVASSRTPAGAPSTSRAGQAGATRRTAAPPPRVLYGAPSRSNPATSRATTPPARTGRAATSRAGAAPPPTASAPARGRPASRMGAPATAPPRATAPASRRGAPAGGRVAAPPAGGTASRGGTSRGGAVRRGGATAPPPSSPARAGARRGGGGGTPPAAPPASGGRVSSGRGSAPPATTGGARRTASRRGGGGGGL